MKSRVSHILFFIIFTFRILMALDSEIIPVKRKINILIYLPLQQIEISRISSREENVLVLTIFMNIYHPYPSDYCFLCANVYTHTHTHTHTQSDINHYRTNSSIYRQENDNLFLVLFWLDFVIIFTEWIQNSEA